MNISIAKRFPRFRSITALIVSSLSIVWGAFMGFEGYATLEAPTTVLDNGGVHIWNFPRLGLCVGLGIVGGYLSYRAARRMPRLLPALLIGYLLIAILIPSITELLRQITSFDKFYRSYGGIEWGFVLVETIFASICLVPLAIVGTLVVFLADRWLTRSLTPPHQES